MSAQGCCHASSQSHVQKCLHWAQIEARQAAGVPGVALDSLLQTRLDAQAHSPESLLFRPCAARWGAVFEGDTEIAS